ncbi:CcdC family protein [Bacillus massiliglaciei]|uniref:CcdC family protein n=1 Tax=Bacillus massiliglaciei TaxID=1816693 RepID=UPI000ABF8442|nr:cytochrome c biogenesis protein CcdC [Bacillus massiliglaciei]
MIYITTGLALIMALVIFKFRMKETERPVNAKNIILPPIFMSTGALMFIFPIFHLNGSQFLEAIFTGMVFSLLLIKTSKFEIRENQIYMQRSKAFIFILIGLLVIRLIAKIVLGTSIEYGPLSGMFFILALGMIFPWRIVMYLQYKKLKETFFGNGKMA